MPIIHTCDRRAHALALAVALPTRLATPAQDEHVAAARRAALGKAHMLVEAARARVCPVHVQLDRHRRRRARRARVLDELQQCARVAAAAVGGGDVELVEEHLASPLRARDREARELGSWFPVMPTSFTLREEGGGRGTDELPLA